MFFTGFTELAGVFNNLAEAEQELFPLVKIVSEAVMMAGSVCEDNYNCVYEGNEAEIFEQVLHNMEQKSRYPRQAESLDYPSNETETLISPQKTETEETTGEDSNLGLTFKLIRLVSKIYQGGSPSF